MDSCVERIERQDATQAVLRNPALGSVERREGTARKPSPVTVEHPDPFVVLGHNRILSEGPRGGVARLRQRSLVHPERSVDVEADWQGQLGKSGA